MKGSIFEISRNKCHTNTVQQRTKAGICPNPKFTKQMHTYTTLNKIYSEVLFQGPSTSRIHCRGLDRVLCGPLTPQGCSIELQADAVNYLWSKVKEMEANCEDRICLKMLVTVFETLKRRCNKVLIAIKQMGQRGDMPVIRT